MQEKISVIVPVYNVEKYLEKCLQSLLCQSYTNIEIIVVDDGSPDNCPNICDEYAQNNDIIYSFHKENGGLSSARNYGVLKATSDWIIFVDSDDYVEKDYVRHLWELREQFNADMAIARVVRENEDGTGRPAPVHNFENYCVASKQAISEVYKAEIVGWSAYGKIFRKKYLLNNPFPDGYYEDCACMYLIIDSCNKVAIGNYEEDYHYINRDGSILRSKLKKDHYRIFDICKEFEGFIREEYPDLDIQTVLLYRLAVTQMLNCQEMSWDDYKAIFTKYRSLFRHNLFRVLNNRKLAKRQKYFMLIHSTTPLALKMQNYLLGRIRKRK